MDLTPRQLEVLGLLADGYRDRDIAPHLHISTVRQHVEDIRRKLDATTRAHAIAIAYRTGILTTDRQRFRLYVIPFAHGAEQLGVTCSIRSARWHEAGSGWHEHIAIDGHVSVGPWRAGVGDWIVRLPSGDIEIYGPRSFALGYDLALIPREDA